MKKLLSVFALVGAVGFSMPAMADPCAAVMCLSVNESAPQQCKDHVDEYFNIRVYHGKHHVFDPGATAAKRYTEVMDHCEGATQEDKDKVNAKYGMLEYSPFEYYQD